MIKRKEIVISENSKDKIIGKIFSELENEPNISFNLFKYAKDFDRFLESPKLFTGQVDQDKIILNSKNYKYWPSSNIIMTNENHKTRITIFYKLYWIYTITYLVLTIPMILSLLNKIIYGDFENSGFLVYLIFLLIFIQK